MRMKSRVWLLGIGCWLLAVSCWVLPANAQRALDCITQSRNFAAGNYSVYPDSVLPALTPAPEGYQLFYLSHYGRHGSRYLNDRKGFDIPYKMLMSADSLRQLTPTGHHVLHEIRLIIEDSERRWGDLTDTGKQQHRDITRRMTEPFPEVFSGDRQIVARSTIVPRCILSMGAALQTLANINPQLQISLQASNRDMWYMNHQDKKLRKGAMTPEAEKAYRDFCAKRERNPRLMRLLFYHPDSVSSVVDEVTLNYYIIKMGILQQNTHLHERTYLMELFTNEELYMLWQQENAWWFINHGFTSLNGSSQPYTQRHLLRHIITDADSCLRMEQPPVHLRYGHETVLLPLVCLLGVNGYDLHTDNLEDLEQFGWIATLVFPMASNLQFAFYRRSLDDDDVLFKVLLNEREATLPLATDCAPYYHWSDFRQHYLKLLDEYKPQKK